MADFRYFLISSRIGESAQHADGALGSGSYQGEHICHSAWDPEDSESNEYPVTVALEDTDRPSSDSGL